MESLNLRARNIDGSHEVHIGLFAAVRRAVIYGLPCSERQGLLVQKVKQLTRCPSNRLISGALKSNLCLHSTLC